MCSNFKFLISFIDSSTDKCYYKKIDVSSLASQYLPHSQKEAKTKEVWKVDSQNRRKQKKTVKLSKEKNTQKALLKRRNLFITMAKEDEFYKELIKKWVELKKSEDDFIANGENATSYDPKEFTGESIHKEEGRVYCSSVVSKFKAMDYLYYECELEDIEEDGEIRKNIVNLCLACTKGCQADLIQTLKPKRGYMVCGCGYHNELEKVVSILPFDLLTFL